MLAYLFLSLSLLSSFGGISMEACCPTGWNGTGGSRGLLVVESTGAPISAQ